MVSFSRVVKEEVVFNDFESCCQRAMLCACLLYTSFLNWITEDALLQVFSNWQKFSAWVMDNKPEYIHGGHLIDIAGYPKFKELILDGVELNPECLVAEELYWTESEQRANIHLKPLEQHKKAGPQN